VRVNFSAAKLSISTLIIMVFLLSIVSPTMAAQLPTSVKLNKTTITITVGSSETLDATVLPANAENKAVTWSSSNSSVAEVVNGKITGVAPGTATIKVKTKIRSKTASCIVVVKAATVQPLPVPAPITVKPVPAPIKPVSPASVSLNKKSISLTVGSSETLNATVLPTNAANKAVTWSSSKTSVATVSDGRITGAAPGTATIKVRTADGNKTANCVVTVKAAIKPTAPAPIKVQPIVPTTPKTVKPVPAPVKSVTPTSVSLNKTSISLTVGSSETLNATVLPANAANKAVTWSSSNKSVAKVANGRITGVAPGTATITVKTAVGNKTTNCIVEVKAGTVTPTVQAPITVKPVPAPVKLVSPTSNPTASGLPKKLTVEKGKSVNLSGTVKCSSGLEKISICVDNYYGATDGVIDTRTVSGNSYNLSNISINSNHAAFAKAGTYNVEIWAKAIGGTGKQVGSLTLIVTPVLQSIRASVSEVSVEVGKSIPAGGSIKITGVYNDGSTKELTWLNDVNWSIKDPTIAKNGNGTIVGVKAGTTTLNVSYQGKTTSVKVVVSEPNDAASLAKQILQCKNISLLTYQPCGKVDGASAYDNIVATANGKVAKRSSYENAPGGTVNLSTTMLKAMLNLASKYSFRVTSIAGASHSKNSRHYAGVAFDIDLLNGQKASTSKYANSYVSCVKTTNHFIESTCIHLDW